MRTGLVVALMSLPPMAKSDVSTMAARTPIFAVIGKTLPSRTQLRQMANNPPWLSRDETLGYEMSLVRGPLCVIVMGGSTGSVATRVLRGEAGRRPFNSGEGGHFDFLNTR